MKKVCGTCNFQVASRAGNNCVEISCAHDGIWRRDSTLGCEKWAEFNNSLSVNDRFSLATQIKNQEVGERHHKEILKSTDANRKTQIALKVLSFLLTILGGLITYYIVSIWTK